MGRHSFSTRAKRGCTAAETRGAQRRRAAAFEQLESRSLLAVSLNVMNYGAVPNDGGDDRNAIVAAINASQPGDTIFFPAGSYRISKEISSHSPDVRVKLGQGRIYRGETQVNYISETGSTQVIDRSILISTGTDPGQPNKKNALFNFRETNPNPATFNVKFMNLTFEGRGLNFATNTGAMVEGVVVDNNHFKLVSGGASNAIEFTTGLRSTTISNNVFDPMQGDNGIYGYNWDRLTIKNNEFRNGNEGIHLVAHMYSSPNLLIEQNYFTGIRRMGIELQGGGVNTIVQDNFYENPVMTPIFNQNNDTFAYSIINDQAVSPIIRRNTALMPTSAQSPDGLGVRIVFEIGGSNVLCEDNYSVGGNHVIAGNGFRATGVARKNRISNYNQAPGNANRSTIAFQNNSANVALTWNINRGRPGPNRRFGEIPEPPPPDPNLPDSPTSLEGEPQGTSTLNLNWNDNAHNEDGFRVEQLLSDGLSWLPVADTSTDENTTSVGGLAPGQSYSFRVIAFNGSGDSYSSNVFTVNMPTGAEVPMAPTDLSGTTVGMHQVDLTWLDRANNEGGYSVERLAEDGQTWLVMANLASNVTSTSLTGMASGKTYFFRVRATYSGGYSDASNITMLKTPLPDIPPRELDPPSRRQVSQKPIFPGGGEFEIIGLSDQFLT